MPIKIGINGCGRTGRAALRNALRMNDAEVVAVNDLVAIDDLAYMIRHDSVHGNWDEAVSGEDGTLSIGDRDIRYFSEKEPRDVPWRSVNVDVVIESSGLFRARNDAAGHLEGGASKVLISAPSSDADGMFVPGVNDGDYDKGTQDVVSMASCTTNSVAPVAKVLHDAYGVKTLFMTTVHAYTASQSILDKPMRKRRRGRAGALSMIPTTTGAAKAAEKVLPELAGRIDGMAVRVPVPDGSITDIVAQLDKEVTADEINERLRFAASEPPFKGILAVDDDDLVSTDIVGNPHSSIVDAPSTRVLAKNTVKMLAWYDNEWAYSRRLVEFARKLVEA